MILIQGANGQGKSNLLEAVYILAVAKSPRASADREMVLWQAVREGAQAQVSAVVLGDMGRVRVQIDFLTGVPEGVEEYDERQGGSFQHPEQQVARVASVQKHIRVNGVPRRASDLVGKVNVVMFSAQDLDLVLGPPAVRRRYLDILISQIDHHYLRALQRYQRIVFQRNHLLKTVSHGGAQAGELDFWDDELVTVGSYLMAKRAETVLALSQKAGPIHLKLTGDGEVLQIAYRPSVDIAAGASQEQLGSSLRMAIELQRSREMAQGFTSCGPHRDDLQMLLDDVDAGLYASRGECRTVALAMRLAEAGYLRDRRGQEPVLLLDDVLSELDAARRSHVLEEVGKYQQCFITTTDVELIDERYLSQMSRHTVRDGRVERVGEQSGKGT